jgi:hypothetical protein
MMSGQLLTGVERLNPLTLSIVLCALGCMGLGILFAPWWGLSGIAFAMAISKNSHVLAHSNVRSPADFPRR